MKRKIIGCIVNDPENDYQSNIIDGLMTQCGKYGYNLAVFSPLVDVSHYDKIYTSAEFNILNLINFDLLDGVVVASEPLTREPEKKFFNLTQKILEEKCKKPVITLDVPMGDYDLVCVDDKSAFFQITSHILDFHKRKKIYFLSGPENFNVSEKRIAGFVEKMKSEGIEVPKEYIFYGDFWYTSGGSLARKIASGQVPMPEAVICANDQMAIGLQRGLAEAGIKVPDQIIVTGYDASQDAALNGVTITSFLPDISGMAQEAVNRIRRIIEPDEPLMSVDRFDKNNLFTGMSCGCQSDVSHTIKFLELSIIRKKRDFNRTDIKDNEDIGRFIESYMLEHLTATQHPSQCLVEINKMIYLCNPYDHFFLCVKSDWLNTEETLVDGYPDEMMSVIHAISETAEFKYDVSQRYANNDSCHKFKTELMLPELFNETDEPYVFYFVPVHFQENVLGYAVLQCDLVRKIKITFVFRNWMRNVNNALEMTRVQNRIMSFSLYDNMTGLYNRRGMDMKLNDYQYTSLPNPMCAVFVFDMDGLKKINDTYGHSDGDFGIMLVASSVKHVTGESEIAIRAGGDEFYIIGIGEYSEEIMEQKERDFSSILSAKNLLSNKPYIVTASVGYHMMPFSGLDKIQETIDIADENMYKNKVLNKKQRI